MFDSLLFLSMLCGCGTSNRTAGVMVERRNFQSLAKRLVLCIEWSDREEVTKGLRGSPSGLTRRCMELCLESISRQGLFCVSQSAQIKTSESLAEGLSARCYMDKDKIEISTTAYTPPVWRR